MPAAEATVGDKVKDIVRVTRRAQSRIADKTLSLEDFSFCHAMFGDASLEDRLRRQGYLESTPLLGRLAGQYANLMLEMFEQYARVDEVAKAVFERMTANRKAGRGAFDAIGRPVSPEKVAARAATDAKNDASSARVISVYLNQRALHEGLSLALMEMARRIAEGEIDRELAPGKVYRKKSAKGSKNPDDAIASVLRTKGRATP